MKHSAAGLTAAVLITGGLLTYISFYESRQQETLDYEKDLSTACDNRTAAIRRELEANFAALHAIRAYMEISTVDESHFASMAARLIDTNASVRSLEWVPRVSQRERAGFEQHLGKHFIYVGDPRKPRHAPVRDEYFPVQFVYPSVLSGTVIGFDANASTGCRKAFESTLETGVPALTEKFPLVEQTYDGYGVIAFLPVNRPERTDGRPVLAGFTASVIQVADVVERALRRMDSRGLDLYVFDRSATPAKEFLYYHPAPVGTRRGVVKSERLLTAAPQEKKLLNVAGREWSFVYVPTPEDAATSKTWRPWILLTIGLSLTAAVVSYLLIHAAHNKRTLGLLTSLETLNRQYSAARDAALDASRSKSQFLANMSHEIRTPMNGILATTELVLRTPLNAEQGELINACHTSGQQLLALLNDILDLSRCESGKLTLESLPFDLRSEITSVMQLYTVMSQQKGVDLTLRWNESAPEWVRGDSTRLKQVLTNLMSNAVKFTDRGSVRLSVSGEDLDESKIRMRFTIEDTGIGIPPEILPNLFAPFVQADGSTTRRYGGTGLGLAICKQLVTLMGGRIDVASTVGKGTKFTLTMDLDRSAPIIPSTRSDEEKAWTVRPIRVLLAEDNAVNQLVAKRLLECQGCTVDVVASGLEAVQRFGSTAYDLVLMDCQMPEMDGFEATRRIRASQRIPHVPIVAVTAQAFQSDRERCLAAGMDDYISKPISTSQLAAALQRWVPADVAAVNASE